MPRLNQLLSDQVNNDRLDSSKKSIQAIPVFVISLARSPERRAAISSHLNAVGVAYKIVDAVDGNTLEPDYVRRLTGGRPIHIGAVGCYLSHLRVYQQMVDENVPVALILEDDAVLNPSVTELLRYGCKSLDFDYCFLDSDDHGERGTIFYDASTPIPVFKGYNAFYLSGGPHCTHAYLVTLSAAQKRLEHAAPITKSIDCYIHLPYTIRFAAIVKPKLAWVSEYSLQSFTSERNILSKGITFAFLRRFSWFYMIRDFIRLKPMRRYAELRRLVASGALPPGRKWRPLQSGS